MAADPIPDAAERERRRQRLIALFDQWEAQGDPEEERESLAELREALGAKRVISDRNLFP